MVTYRMLAKNTEEDLDPEGEEFRKLCEFTLKLWQELGENDGNIYQYFHNLGDTKIEITKDDYKITYIVLSQFSKLDILAGGRTDKIVERLKSSFENKNEVKLGDKFGGDYEICSCKITNTNSKQQQQHKWQHRRWQHRRSQRQHKWQHRRLQRQHKWQHRRLQRQHKWQHRRLQRQHKWQHRRSQRQHKWQHRRSQRQHKWQHRRF